VTGSIYSGDPGVDRHHVIFISSYHTTKLHTLSFQTFGLTHSFRGSTQLRRSSWPGSIISSHPHPTLLEPEPLILTNSIWMSREVPWSVVGGLSDI